MGKPGPKTPEISDDVFIQLIQTKTDVQTASTLGVSRSFVARKRRGLGIGIKPKRPKGYYDLTPEQDEQIKKLYQSGRNDYDVAREMHLGRTRLREWRNKNGIISKTNKKGLTLNICKEAEKRHKEGESFTSIAKTFNVGRGSIVKLLKRNNIAYKSSKRTPPKDIKDYLLTDYQKEFLLGDMFGDGGLVSSSEKSAYYQCGHSLEQEEFVKWKYEVLKPLSCRLKHIKYRDNQDPNIIRNSVVMATWSTHELKEWHRKFYPSGKGNKVLTPELASMMTELSLAVWYMGDGTKSRSGLIVVGKQIDSFPIVEVLNRRFGNIFGLRDDKKQWSIIFKDPPKFFDMILPYVLPCMKYKIPEKFWIGGADIFSMTPKVFNNLSKTEQGDLIEKAFIYYRKKGFPYLTLSDERKKNISMSLQSMPPSLTGNTTGVNLCECFFPHIYGARRYDRRAPMDYWDNDFLFRKILKNRFKYSPVFSDAALRRGFKLIGAVSNFKPAVAKYIYDKYLPQGGVTYDFCSGYGGRLLGFLAARDKNGKYIGIDPLKKTCMGLESLASFWHNQISKCSVEIIDGCAEDFCGLPESIDFAFSSPPYYDLEKYSDDENQSYKKYNSYKIWLELFWDGVAKNCFKMLKSNGHFAYVVGNYSSYDLVGDFEKICIKTGFIKKDSFQIPVANLYNKKRTGNNYKYETLFVYGKSSDSLSCSHKSDVNEIFQIVSHYYKIGWMGFLPLKVYYSALEKGNIFIQKIENKIVGFILFRKLEDDSIRIIQLACHKDFLRKGIGKELLEKVKMLPHKKLILKVVKKNQGAVSFYSSLGMKIENQDEKFLYMGKENNSL